MLKLNTPAAPHIRHKDSTRSVMLDVCIALIPSTLFAIFNFGLYAFVSIAIAIVSAILAEYAYEKILGKPVTVKDCSALLTGLLVGLNMTPGTALWVPAAASVIAIVIFKQLFGGIGKNYVNPALGGRVVFFVACFISSHYLGGTFSKAVGLTDYSTTIYSGATPLTTVANPEFFGYPNVASTAIGFCSGSFGEVSAIALVIGLVYLLCRKVITWHIPVIYSLSTVVFMMLLNQTFTVDYALIQLFGGGLLFGAIFMATDYVTSPTTIGGKIVYALILGLVTALIRSANLGFYEGVSIAIVIVNIFARLIDKIFMPVAFGCKKSKASKA